MDAELGGTIFKAFEQGKTSVKFHRRRGGINAILSIDDSRYWYKKTGVTDVL